MALEEKSLKQNVAMPQDEGEREPYLDPVWVTPKPLVKTDPKSDQESKPLPPDLVSFILPRRGVSAEEKEAYHDLYLKIFQAFRPGDVIEQIEIARIACLMWDCSCLTRYLNALLLDARDESLKRLFRGRIEDADAVAEGVRRGDPEAIASAREILMRFGLNDEDVHARSFIDNIEIIDRLKRMEMAATREFTRLLKDLDYRKKVREAARLRELNESLTYQHFRKHALDPNMKAPK